MIGVRSMRRGFLWGAGLAAFTLAAAGGAGAQELADYDYTNLSFQGAGLSWGYVWPTKVKATGVYSARVDLGYLGPNLRIVPNLSYWRSTMRQGELDSFAARINAIPSLRNQGATLTGADLAPVHWSDVALEVDGQWVAKTPTGVLAYVGLGLGVHALHGSGAAIEDTFIQDLLNTVTPALTGLGGLEYGVADRVRIFGEARLTAMGDIQYGALRAGATLMFPGQTPTAAPAKAPPLPPSGSNP